ncbi:hypothetical protein [Paraburkholderia hospita]|uniref:hypothetical protein n=1 Tax=Paraburkholderia hospita TaxID=169430 RepID=UPI000271C731|nr:hypothetical protein [Paraburkholderia hospita]EUC14329.1 hypothetical protein PMI06_006740 [Burkholderia sp. BT03]SKC93635.1 hypothetical protein SAMN06266956_5683 [Paraburkholderia hospita]
MQESIIQAQVNRAVDTFGLNQKMVANQHAAWRTFASFVEHRAPLPERLEDIDREAVAAFVMHCRSMGMQEDALITILSALRMLLMHAGHPAAALTALTAPTSRTRMPNGANGKYHFQRRFREPPGAHAGCVPHEEEKAA